MLQWLKELTPEQAAEAIDGAWSRFAATEDGRIVLATLLEECKLLDPLKDGDEVTRHNVAVMILRRLRSDSIPRVIAALTTGGRDAD